MDHSHATRRNRPHTYSVIGVSCTNCLEVWIPMLIYTTQCIVHLYTLIMTSHNCTLPPTLQFPPHLPDRLFMPPHTRHTFVLSFLFSPPLPDYISFFFFNCPAPPQILPFSPPRPFSD